MFYLRVLTTEAITQAIATHRLQGRAVSEAYDQPRYNVLAAKRQGSYCNSMFCFSKTITPSEVLPLLSPEALVAYTVSLLKRVKALLTQPGITAMD